MKRGRPLHGVTLIPNSQYSHREITVFTDIIMFNNTYMKSSSVLTHAAKLFYNHCHSKALFSKGNSGCTPFFSGTIFETLFALPVSVHSEVLNARIPVRETFQRTAIKLSAFQLYSQHQRSVRRYFREYVNTLKVVDRSAYNALLKPTLVPNSLITLCIDMIDARNGLKYNPFYKWMNSKKTINLYWCGRKRRNFGDELSRLMIPALFGYSIRYSQVPKCDMVAIGSIIQIVQARNPTKHHLIAWGSGFIKNVTVRNLDSVDFRAVRGKITAAKLSRNITVFGDPGLLASVLFKQSPYVHNRIGLVVHYIDLGLPIVKLMRRDPRFTVINTLNNAETVCLQISQCTSIISSSLHGMIVADSYQIPNCRLRLSSRVTGDEFKFQDYCSGVDREFLQIDISRWSKEPPADLHEILPDSLLQSMFDKYKPISELVNRQRALVSAFPSYSDITAVRRLNKQRW